MEVHDYRSPTGDPPGGHRTISIPSIAGPPAFRLSAPTRASRRRPSSYDSAGRSVVTTSTFPRIPATWVWRARDVPTTSGHASSTAACFARRGPTSEASASPNRSLTRNTCVLNDHAGPNAQHPHRSLPGDGERGMGQQHLRAIHLATQKGLPRGVQVRQAIVEEQRGTIAIIVAKMA